MSTRVHCDGPDCEETRDANHIPIRLCEPYWIRVEERPDSEARDFHSRECLNAWATREIPPKQAEPNIGTHGHAWPCPLFYVGNWSITGTDARAECNHSRGCPTPTETSA